MRGNRNYLIIFVTLLGFIIGTVRSVRAVSNQPTIEELYQKLEQRDTIIFDLLERVEQLEKRVITATANTKIITVQPGDTLREITRRAYGDDHNWLQIYNANRPQLPNPDTIEVGMTLVIPSSRIIAEEGKLAQKNQVAHSKTPELKNDPAKDTQIKQKSTKASRKTNDTPVANTQAKAAPGQFIVDEEAAERALERTLIQEGALLLRYGEIEFQPSFNYIRSENNNTLFVNITDELNNESNFTTKEKDSRDILISNLAIRAGLPFNSQLELSIPYKYVDRSKFTELRPPLDFVEEKNSDSGLGDIRVGLAKTLLREDDGWWPDIIGRVTWDSATGENDIAGLSNGFHEAIGSLTFLKRQDPLAFVGSVGYQRSFEKDDFKPGDQLDFRIGLSLAASPETSLSFSLSQSFVYESEIGSRKMPGSDQNIGIMNIGASSIIGRKMFVNLSAGIGLTDDAPDYSVGLSFSKRFNWQSSF